MWFNNILEIIGKTPMVRLNKIAKDVKPTILAKLEYLNPGGSIKERMALYILQEAEKEGKLKPGDTIVEATAGNTGVGIAMFAAVKNYKSIFTIPDKVSKEKIDLLKAFGAKVIVCPTEVPENSPEHYINLARKIAQETPKSFLLSEEHNPKNREAHYKTTGPEIWEQTNGKVDYVIIGIGSGGTISGVGKFLKEKNKNIKIIGVDPIGSIFYNYFKEKRIIEPRPYLVEGIGMEILCEALDFSVIDDIIQVNDKDAFLTTRRLLKEEGILAGGSSGAAVWVALEVAKNLSEDKIIVTILPDTGRNYLTKIFNDDWLKERGII